MQNVEEGGVHSSLCCQMFLKKEFSFLSTRLPTQTTEAQWGLWPGITAERIPALSTTRQSLRPRRASVTPDYESPSGVREADELSPALVWNNNVSIFIRIETGLQNLQSNIMIQWTALAASVCAFGSGLFTTALLDQGWTSPFPCSFSPHTLPLPWTLFQRHHWTRKWQAKTRDLLDFPHLNPSSSWCGDFYHLSSLHGTEKNILCCHFLLCVPIPAVTTAIPTMMRPQRAVKRGVRVKKIPWSE